MDFPKSVPGVGLIEGQFADEDLVLGRQGSLIPAAWGNQVTKELLAVIEAAGMAASEEESDQLLRSIQKLQSDLSADSGVVVLSAVGVTNWAVPDILKSGKKTPYVVVVGGGGGVATQASLSRGGAGAGAAEGLINLAGVSSVSVSVGAGGIASTGWAGQSSSFGSFMSATGGQAGQAGVGSFSDPGQGSGGALNRRGSPGGGPDGANNGEGGASPYTPGTPRSGSGILGGFPGGGAGAGSSPQGNPGGNGVVIIRW